MRYSICALTDDPRGYLRAGAQRQFIEDVLGVVLGVRSLIYKRCAISRFVKPFATRPATPISARGQRRVKLIGMAVFMQGPPPNPIAAACQTLGCRHGLLQERIITATKGATQVCGQQQSKLQCVSRNCPRYRYTYGVR